jgi:hypothetical protein
MRETIPGMQGWLIRVRVPTRQAVGRRAVAKMRGFKQEVLGRLSGVIGHD